MKTYLTEIRNFQPYYGDTLISVGPRIEAETIEKAQIKLNKMNIINCKIVGVLISETDYNIEYEIIANN